MINIVIYNKVRRPFLACPTWRSTVIILLLAMLASLHTHFRSGAWGLDRGDVERFQELIDYNYFSITKTRVGGIQSHARPPLLT